MKIPRNHLGLLTAIALSTIPAWSQELPKPEIARALSSPGKPFGDLHPNAAGHAWCASLIIPRLFTILGLNPR